MRYAWIWGFLIGVFLVGVSDWYESQKHFAVIEGAIGIRVECDGSFFHECWQVKR